MRTEDTAAQVLDRHGITDDSEYSAWEIPWGERTLLLDTWRTDRGDWVAKLLDVTVPRATREASFVPCVGEDRGASKREAAERILDGFLRINR
jgi:hypothetical protein